MLPYYRLQPHVLGGVDGVEVWLRGEGGVAHHLLDTASTLKENLSNRTLTEFPILHVVTKGAGPPPALTSRETIDTPRTETSPAGPVSKHPPAALSSPTGSRGHEIGVGSGDVPGRECGEVPRPLDSEGKNQIEAVKSSNGDIGTCSSLQLIASMYSDDEES